MKRLLTLATGLLAPGMPGLPVILAMTPMTFAATAQEAEIERTVTFNVPGMTCALCPITVKKAMEGAEGVRKVEVDVESRTATVVFDPFFVTVEAIARASENAGYPAYPEE